MFRRYQLKNNDKIFFDSITMLRFGKIKVLKEKFYGEKTIKVQNVNVDNIVVSKLIETKANSNYLAGYLDEVIRPLVFISLKEMDLLKFCK